VVGWHILKDKRKQTNSIAKQIKIISEGELIKDNGTHLFGSFDFLSLEPLVPVLLEIFSEFDVHVVLTRRGAGGDLGSTSAGKASHVHHLKLKNLIK
jgi:hypothetical protein